MRMVPICLACNTRAKQNGYPDQRMMISSDSSVRQVRNKMVTRTVQTQVLQVIQIENPHRIGEGFYHLTQLL